jgi:hypothetical protein
MRRSRSDWAVRQRARPVAIAFALALCLPGCSARVGVQLESQAASAAPSDLVSAAPSDELSAAPSDELLVAPSGKPAGLELYGSVGNTGCPDQLEGPLLADVKVERYVWGTYDGIVIEVSPDDAGVWPEPSGVDPWPVPLVPVRWPESHRGVRLADGEVAVVNAGRLVAMTGMNYRLKGDWAILGSIGGPKFPHEWIHGFNVCPDMGSVVPQ